MIILAAVLFALAGAMFVASAGASQGGDLRVERSGGLAGAISGRAEQNAALQQDVAAFTGRVDTLRAEGDPSIQLETVNTEIDELAAAVALTEVAGPGVTVSLDDADAPNPIPEGYTGDDYIVHQQDVQGVVNALWRGGASGVTVMGQRLVSTSAVRCVGNTVILEGQVHSPPFVIEAVGDIDRLQESLAADSSVTFFRDWATVVGMSYDETYHQALTLPPYTGPTTTVDSQVVP